MKFNKVIQFRADDVVVEFHKVDIVGYSHKVLVIKNGNLVAKDWLTADMQPAAKHAEFFYDKHSAKIAA